TYTKEMDLAILKNLFGKYSGAVPDGGTLTVCPDELPDDVSAALETVAPFNDEYVLTFYGSEYTEEAVEAYFRDLLGLGDGWDFYLNWFDADAAAADGNDVAIGFRNDDVNGEGRTYVIGYEVVLKIEDAGPVPDPDPIVRIIDERFEELACIAHWKLDLVFGTSGTLDDLSAVLEDIFGYPASVSVSEIQRIKNDYAMIGNGQTAWIDDVVVTFTNPVTGSEYEKAMDMAFLKMIYGTWSGAIDGGHLGCCPDEWPSEAADAAFLNGYDETPIEIADGVSVEEALEAYLREATGLGADWMFSCDVDDSYACVGFVNNDVNGEGRTVVIAGSVIFTVAEQHNYVSVVTDPTCTEPGYTTHTCTICGDSYVDERVDPLGHNYSDYVIAPKCTSKGYTRHKCTRCGDNYVDTYTDALGHDFGEWTVTVAPNCTEEGEETRYCSRCDAYETRTVAAPGHDYVPAVTAPSCTEGGFTTHTCSRCGDAFVDTYVPALGHDYVDGICTRCGADDPNCAEALVENKRAKAGDEITVDVRIADSPLLKSIAISDITLDSPVLTLLGVEWDIEDIALSSWDDNTGMGVAAMTQARDINGSIVTLTLKVSDDAEDGDYSLTLSVRAKGENNADVSFTTTPGTVTVWSVVRGDFTGDEIVTDDDALYLLFNIFFPETYPLNQDGDINGDGAVTDDDAIYLLFYTFFPDTY
ncbi:MAG: hypothetical protein IKN36_08115, partial [Clostridia bacterium]|nr:hypothetical protein [Clostridia bacterium]